MMERVCLAVILAKIVLAVLVVQRRRTRRAEARGRSKEAAVLGRVHSVPNADLRLPVDFCGASDGSADTHDAVGAISLPGQEPKAHAAPDGVLRESSDGSASSWDAAKMLWVDMQGGSRGSSRSAVPQKPLSSNEPVSMPSHGSGSGSSANVAVVRGEVQQAVAALQGALQKELHEDELHLYDVLGRGGFGTVYHGACRRGAHLSTYLRHFQGTGARVTAALVSGVNARGRFVVFRELGIPQSRQRTLVCTFDACVTRRTARAIRMHLSVHPDARTAAGGGQAGVFARMYMHEATASSPIMGSVETVTGLTAMEPCILGSVDS